MKNERVRKLKKGKKKGGPILYWMSRDQRADDNWALLFAQEKALEQKVSLGVVFCLVSQFLGAGMRQYGFMLRGLQETQEKLREKNIPFFLLEGSPEVVLPPFVSQHEVSELVTDFDPLRVKEDWKKDLVKKIDIPFFDVDTHNIVPCWTASSKQEFAARTFRPKVNRQLEDFLEEFPNLERHPFSWKGEIEKIHWNKVKRNLKINRAVREVDWTEPGEKAARLLLNHFTESKLSDYDAKRNDPNWDAQSNLSPYLHFGQISPQRVVLEIRKKSPQSNDQEAFLEEIVVRRELADNFCFYNDHYDEFLGFPDWSRKTLNEHRNDQRAYIYSLEQLESFQTHDDLWNAAQKEMVESGKMHGYMRMYWAKKILQWTPNPEEALRMGIFLNDKYELDGRDPNGYSGVAWAIGGVHDRAWPSREIFGKVRYMSYKGAQSKFDVRAYIKKNSAERSD
ncbi:deoxyribodipyrimidine photo-lyase [bacterium]|nr:deoxyribodipyrimidine photo-lyase [bacterium]